MQNDRPSIPEPNIRLRRTGARRGGRPRPALTGRAFQPRQPKGKGAYVALMALVVVAGFFLQLNWMQQARKKTAPDLVVPGGFADKLGRWMLMKKGVDPNSMSGAPGVETIECGFCMGTGNLLSDESRETICPICQGVGSRLIRRLDENDRICPFCGGMGRAKLPDTGQFDTCPRCGGRGLVRRPPPADSAPGEN